MAKHKKQTVQKKYTFQIRLQDTSNNPLVGVKITPIIPKDERLGETFTNKKGIARLGFFSDNFDKQYRGKGVMTTFYVHDDEKLIGTLRQELYFKKNGGYNIKLDFVLDVEVMDKSFAINILTKSKKDGGVLPYLDIEAWYAQPEKEKLLLGKSITDEDGKGQINFKSGLKLIGDQRGYLFIKVSKEGKVIYDSLLEEKTWRFIADVLDVVLLLPKVEDNDYSKRVVCGVVRDEFNVPISNAIVQAFDKDLRNEELLGTVSTDKEGYYEISYNSRQFKRAEKEFADLIIKVRKSKRHKKNFHQTSVLFNAPVKAEININLSGKKYEGASEFELMTNCITPLLDKLSPLELREDDEYQDGSFLAGETGYSLIKLGNWIAAHRLAARTKLEPVVFFAFLRQGQPGIAYDNLLADIKFPERITLLEEKMLKATANLTPELQKDLIERAISENYIPAKIQLEIDKVLEILNQMRLDFMSKNTFGAGKGTISELLELTQTTSKENTTFLKYLNEHSGSMANYWKNLKEQNVFKEKVVEELRITFELGALTKNYIPLVKGLKNLLDKGKAKEIRSFARYSVEDWKKLLSKQTKRVKAIGAPANKDGKTEEDKMDMYANELNLRFERTFPTTAFSANLLRATNTPITQKKKIASFLDKNPDFDLNKIRIDHYVAANPNSIKDEVVKEELKAVQRVFKLSPTYTSVETLMKKEIQSAQQVYFKGKEQFIGELSDSGISKSELGKIYAKSEITYTLALDYFGNFNSGMTGVTPTTIPELTLDAAQEKIVEQLPNLQTLFGSMDYCECEHCRSVYSPAAYYVDILRFISERKTNKPNLYQGPPLTDIFFARRPDLGELELSCKNTNTPLPYIDLVNEILEDAVASPDPVASITIAQKQNLPTTEVHEPLHNSIKTALGIEGIQVEEGAIAYRQDIRNQWAVRDSKQAFRIEENGTKLDIYITRQTFWSAAELRANPEYTNPKAYNTNHLGGAVFPFSLPFDLWNIQTRAYLKHLGVEQYKLFELFQQGGTTPSPLEINSSYLNITNVERTIVTNTSTTHDAWDYWGLNETANNVPNPITPTDNTTNYTGSWIDVLCHVPILLHHSKLNYRELLQILDLQFINPTGNIFVNTLIDTNTASCDSSTFKIVNLTQDVLTRINQFVRLWRKVDIEMWELDVLIRDLGAGQITDGFISELATLQKIKLLLKLDWVTALSLTKNIDSSNYVDRTKPGFPEIQNLYQRLYRNKLVDAVSIFPDDPADLSPPLELNDDTIPGILAASKLKESELDLIVDYDGNFSVGAPLNISILSSIYRYSILSKALKISVKEFIDLISMSGIDPFSTLTDSWRFIQLTHKITASNFSIDELNYLLNHVFIPGEGINIDDETIADLLFEIRAGLQKIEDDLNIKEEESPEEYISNKLGLMPSLDTDEKQQLALAILMGTWDGTDGDRNTFLDDNLGAIFSDLAATKTFLTTDIYGTATEEDKDEDLKAWFKNDVQPDLQNYLLVILKENWIIQQLSDAFDLDLNRGEKLLRGIELNAGVTILDEFIANLNVPDILAKSADDEYINNLNETNYVDIFNIVKVLHKNSLVVIKLDIESDEIIWLLNNANIDLNSNGTIELEWINPKDYPFVSGSNIPIDRWEKMYDFFSWKKDLKPSDLTATSFMSKVLDDSLLNDFPTDYYETTKEALSKIVKAEIDDIESLLSSFGWGTPSTLARNIRISANLLRISKCLNSANRLGVSTIRAISWANANPDQSIAESLKQTVKAKYELPQWQEVIQPLQDEFREAKRDALVSWLIANPNATQNQFWVDENGLFSYYLIDVEMSSCMLTSRIKQASAAVQFFVQRCLLNIEKEVLATGSVWKRWKWMKYYRLWEANRKVFLYPENWIEPELRDEKTPFFKELESELMQDEITKGSVERAYLNYLEKLDKVANLEIRAMHTHYLDNNKKELYVFGRTRSSVGAEYFWRKRTKEELWTAWQKIDLKIESDQLIPAIHNERLYLFWPQFIEKAREPNTVSIPTQGASNVSIAKPIKYNEVRLFWSEYTKQGKWTPEVLSDKHLEFAVTFPKEDLKFRLRRLPNIHIKAFVGQDSVWAPYGNRGISKIGKQLPIYSDLVFSEKIIAPPNSVYYGNLLRSTSPNYHFYYDSILDKHLVPPQHNALSISVLNNFQGEAYTVLNSEASSFEDKGSFFLWDDRRSYFVDYDYSTYFTYDYDYPNILNQHIKRDFRFYINYHPFVELFIKELNIKGLNGLLNRTIQVAPETIPGSPSLFDFNEYSPNTQTVLKPYPVEEVDFEYRGPYSPYNWELFFHVPFFIANNLSNNQRFEEALEWYHYIFDPTNSDTNTANPDTPQQKFWITKPFYETTKADYYKQRIENLLLLIAQGQADLVQVEGWRDNPFNPHLVARMRTVAYQKSILIKYIKTIIAWGDQLYRRETIETVSEATQLYILASEILGPKPKSIPRQVPNPPKTYYQLKKKLPGEVGIDAFGNVLMDIENILPTPNVSGTSNDDTPELPRLNLLYFCVPHNDVLLQLWDLVAGRLYNIRHCLNIDGLALELPLFEPPIDPSAVVAAAAGGGGFGAALGDLNAPLPHYRFRFMIQKALELCSEIKSLGGALLSALEKKDAEELALLRSSNEIILLDAVKSIRKKQIEEATFSLDALKESKKTTEYRKEYYEELSKDGWTAGEITAFSLSTASTAINAAMAVGYILAGGLKVVPQFVAGAAGFGGSPTVSVETGGESLGGVAEFAVKTLSAIATSLDKGASLASTTSSYSRRAREWEYQIGLAEKEIPQIEKQIEAARTRLQITAKELSNHEIQIDNRVKEDEFMRSKYTNKELYTWMTNQISTLYFQSYQLAYDIAKKAERCLRYELGLSTSNYIQFGYWDSLHKGLLSGEKLHYDLKRMEMAYYEQNRRDYELTKHIALSQIAPVALLKLRQNGECFIDIPEAIFNMDYPGHYFRRIKSMSISIPCIVGPNTTVACTLTMMSNSIRKDATLLAGKYERDLTTDDIRFKDEITGTQSIATSGAQNDSGVFNLNFQDERYVPFEGAGAISRWHLKLNTGFRQFDYNTITDVILHMSYTAKEGGKLLATNATIALVDHLKNNAADPEGNLYHVFDVKRTFGNEFHKFLNPITSGAEQALVLDKITDSLPFYTKEFNTKELIQVEVIAKMKNNEDYEIMVTPAIATTATAFSNGGGANTKYGGLHNVLFSSLSVAMNQTFNLKIKEQSATDFTTLSSDAIEELFLMINYKIENP